MALAFNAAFAQQHETRLTGHRAAGFDCRCDILDPHGGSFLGKDGEDFRRQAPFTRFVTIRFASLSLFQVISAHPVEGTGWELGLARGKLRFQDGVECSYPLLNAFPFRG